MGSVRAAGIDCGTNSIRLLVADVDPLTGRLTDVVRLLRLVRLGEGVDSTGRLAPAALERTLAAVAEYAELCRDLGCQAVRMAATSATRDAANAAEFTGGVRQILGVEPEVVDGLAEAALSFEGAMTAVDGEPPYLVVDVGGGSTELVLGETGPQAAHSMDVGCVRMTERHLRSDPPSPAELAAAQEDVDAALDQAEAHVDLGAARTLVGVAGTVGSVTAHALGLRTYDPSRVDGAILPADDVLSACRSLWSMTRRQRGELGFLEPRRADVIGGGALVWARTVERIRQATARAGHRLETIVSSEHDILDGLTQSAARRARPAGDTHLAK
ncbi:MAG: Ppx/GppA family phosphatase [Bifidobacteriaceae bacterium]|nr:Ppx/GppA family phosphatase [Bifidobacteriaceae bacterium]